MKLPNAERAVVDIRKLRDYCLDPQSPKGRNKARVFKAALGLTKANAEVLRRSLLQAAYEEECVPGEQDVYGQRYTLDFFAEFGGSRARVRSGWIVKSDEGFPRLTTCYVLERKARS